MAKLEEVLVSVWKQALEDDDRIVLVEGESFRVRLTSKRKLKQVDFRFDGRELRGLEQNPETKFTLGKDGSGREESHAVSGRRKVCGGRRRWRFEDLLIRAFSPVSFYLDILVVSLIHCEHLRTQAVAKKGGKPRVPNV